MDIGPLPDGTVYSRRKNLGSPSTQSLADYASLLGQQRIEGLVKLARPLRGMRILEVSATAGDSGIAEMLNSSVPFLNALGIETEWKIVPGQRQQAQTGHFVPAAERIYPLRPEQFILSSLIDNSADVVTIHGLPPLGLARYVRRTNQVWLWRCPVDFLEIATEDSDWYDFATSSMTHYDAAIFSGVPRSVPPWPLPKFVIAPFIDPFSEKNRELTRDEIEKVLDKYGVNPEVAIIIQTSRFAPGEELDRTIAVFRLLTKEKKCQLILAGNTADNEPQGRKVLADICEKTKDDQDILILDLSGKDRLENYRGMNALQRAATIILQQPLREGFGLEIAEALWKRKPVVTVNTGEMPLPIRNRDTDYFRRNSRKTAKLIQHLLDNPKKAGRLGERGRRYVEQHFLLPNRIADYLMAIQITMAVKEKTRHRTVSTPYSRTKREGTYVKPFVNSSRSST